LGTLKLTKQKKFENFQLIFYSVQGAWCGSPVEIYRRSENIQALLKIGKYERQSTVASALKG
jgi:hypothetical protein